jgi:hypothetical protein
VPSSPRFNFTRSDARNASCCEACPEASVRKVCLGLFNECEGSASGVSFNALFGFSDVLRGAG